MPQSGSFENITELQMVRRSAVFGDGKWPDKGLSMREMAAFSLDRV